MDADLERLKQRLPLLEYLQRHNWSGRRAGAQQEFVGLCPLHRETHPSFYVNARRNLFYCDAGLDQRTMATILGQDQSIRIRYPSINIEHQSSVTPAPSSSSSSAILQIIFATLSAASGSTTSNASGGSLQPSSGTATSSLASEIASYQSQLQTESIQALFGTGSTTGVSGTTLNVFG